MTNKISAQDTPVKYNGNVHNRKNELKSYRKMIDRANNNLERAVNQGNYDEADYWSKTIDATQARIAGIIDQEDNHSYKKPETYNTYVKTTTDGIDSVVNSGVRVVESIPKAPVKAAGEILDMVA